MQSGDVVAVHGVVGNTNANTGTGQGIAGGVPVTVSGTSVTEVGVAGNAGYTSGGVLSVLTR